MLEYSGKLIKIESTHNNMRTDEFVGHFAFLPEEGGSFVIYGEPISENMSVRYIRTSMIKSIDWIYEKIVEIKTQNSTYHLELN